MNISRTRRVIETRFDALLKASVLSILVLPDSHGSADFWTPLGDGKKWIRWHFEAVYRGAFLYQPIEVRGETDPVPDQAIFQIASIELPPRDASYDL